MVADGTEILLWSFTHEFSNSFIQYLVGGIFLMYLVTMFITYCSSDTTPLIQNIALQDHSIPEKELHKYLLIVDTSWKPGVNCPRQTVIYFELVGELTQSGFNKISIYTNGRFIFQCGNKDMFLIKTKQCLGKILEVKIINDYEKWKPVRTEVIKISTGDRYIVPTRVINPESKNCPEDGVYYPVTKRSLCKTVLMALLQYHQWFSFLLPVRIGVYTSTVNILVLFLGLSLLLMGTLIVYIVKAPPTGDSFQINQSTLEWTIYVSIFAFVSVGIFQMLLRNIRSGYLPDIKKMKEQMLRNETKLCYNRNNPLYGYLEEKKFNFPLGYDDHGFESCIEFEQIEPEFKSALEFEKIKPEFKSTLEFEKIEPEFKSALEFEKIQPEFRSALEFEKIQPEFKSALAFEKIEPEFKSALEFEKIEPECDDEDGYIEKSSEKVNTYTDRKHSCNDLDDLHMFKSALEFNHLNNQSSEVSVTKANAQDNMGENDFHSYKSAIEFDNNVKLPEKTMGNRGLIEKTTVGKTGPPCDEINIDQAKCCSKSSSDTSTGDQNCIKPIWTTHSEEGVYSKQLITTISDTGVLLYLRQSNLDDQCREGLTEIDSETLQKFVMEFNDKFVNDKDIRGECVLSLKEVIRKVCQHQIRLNRKIRQGNIDCSTGLEVVVRSWCETLRKEIYKIITSLAIQKGISREALLHSIQENMPNLTDLITSMSSCHVCTIIEQCCGRLTNQRTLTRPDVEEMCLTMMVRLYKMADNMVETILLPGISRKDSTFTTDWIQSSRLLMDYSKPVSASMISLRGSPTFDRRSIGLIEHLTQQSSSYSITPSEYSVLYALATSVVKLSFHNQEWILTDDWYELTQGHTSDYLDDVFTQKQNEFLTVWRLCSRVTEVAQKELLEEYKDATFIYTQLMVRQMILSSLQNISGENKEWCNKLRHELYKHWNKQGFKPRLNAVKRLSEILVSRFISQVETNKDQNMMDENSLYYPLSQSHMLHIIQTRVEHEITRSVKKLLFGHGGSLRFLSKPAELMALFDRGDNLVEEHIYVVVDLAIQDIMPILYKTTDNVVTRELSDYYMAPDLVRKVDSAQHSLMVEKQVMLYEEYGDTKFAREFMSTVKSLQPMLLQLRYVRDIQKELNTIKPETYIEKVQNKHSNFVMVNLQNVLESASTPEDDGVNFTDNILYELEWDVTGENRKCIPHFVKIWMVFVIFCGTVFNLVYTLFIGGQLSIPQLKEWVLYWIVSLGIYGLVLFPLFTVIVGILFFHEQK